MTMLINNYALDTYVTSVIMKSTVTVTIESSAVIVCNITLNTAIGPDLSVLNYYWYFNNMLTNFGALLHNIDRKTFNTTLEIISVRPSNAGVYQCSAGIVGGNTITSNTTSLCVKGIIIVYKLFYAKLSLQLVAENDLYPISEFTGLQLGEMFVRNCVLGSISGLSISWWRNNTLFFDHNRIETPPLQLSDNNTIYTCIISIQQNPSNCPKNQSREYVIKLKS